MSESQAEQQTPPRADGQPCAGESCVQPAAPFPEKPKTVEGLTFEQWFDQVKKIANDKYDLDHQFAEGLRPEDWIDGWEDGYSAEHCMDEEVSCWEIPETQIEHEAKCDAAG